jgi:hypothetical protein
MMNANLEQWIAQRLVWAALELMILFHIAASLSYSLRNGRLTSVPLRGDVGYLTEGLLHLRAFDSAPELLSDFWPRASCF